MIIKKEYELQQPLCLRVLDALRAIGIHFESVLAQAWCRVRQSMNVFSPRTSVERAQEALTAAWAVVLALLSVFRAQFASVIRVAPHPWLARTGRGVSIRFNHMPPATLPRVAHMCARVLGTFLAYHLFAFRYCSLVSLALRGALMQLILRVFDGDKAHSAHAR